MKFDHVAVPSNDIAASVNWYGKHLGAKPIYQDESWAFLEAGGQKLALVSPHQHPPHVAFSVSEQELEEASRATSVAIDEHRDGSRAIYLHDPFGNAVELICYLPASENVK